MKYDVFTVATFEKNAKRLLKKYPSLKNELDKLKSELTANPLMGTPIGSNCYKIRIAISSKNKGKSGGGRIITNVYVEGEMVFLITIYDKSEKENLTEAELQELLSKLGNR